MITSGNFTFYETSIRGLTLVEGRRFGDSRGYFSETWHEKCFAEGGFSYRFVQDNQSSSRKGVLRGLHFQRNFPQAKLVRILHGEVFDVAVDLRKGSATYGKWEAATLTEENGLQLLIPRGFAHGFLVLSEMAEFAYKCDDIYHPEDEGGIIWNDPDIGISWPETTEIILSEKDRRHPTLAESRVELCAEG